MAIVFGVLFDLRCFFCVVDDVVACVWVRVEFVVCVLNLVVFCIVLFWLWL